MIKYSLTLIEVTNEYVSIIFELNVFGYTIKNHKILFSRMLGHSNNSDTINLIEFGLSKFVNSEHDD